jgi:hypothetical protein
VVCCRNFGLTPHLSRVVDNLYVGHSADDAEKLAKETYHIKHVAELAEEGDVDEDEENKLSTVDKLKLKVYQFASE